VEPVTDAWDEITEFLSETARGLFGWGGGGVASPVAREPPVRPKRFGDAVLSEDAVKTLLLQKGFDPGVWVERLGRWCSVNTWVDIYSRIFGWDVAQVQLLHPQYVWIVAPNLVRLVVTMIAARRDLQTGAVRERRLVVLASWGNLAVEPSDGHYSFKVKVDPTKAQEVTPTMALRELEALEDQEAEEMLRQSAEEFQQMNGIAA